MKQSAGEQQVIGGKQHGGKAVIPKSLKASLPKTEVSFEQIHNWHQGKQQSEMGSSDMLNICWTKRNGVIGPRHKQLGIYQSLGPEGDGIPILQFSRITWRF